MTKQAELTATAQFDWPLLDQSQRCTRFLVVDVTATAPEPERADKRAPLNMCIVIDASGSMSGEKIEAARSAAIGVAEALQPEDILSVVSFAADQIVHVDRMPAHPADRAEAVQGISQISTRGTTDLAAGWMKGAEIVTKAMQQHQDTRNRVVVLSDGMANRGITDPEQLSIQAEALQQRGILTSTVGIGDGYSTTQLRVLAEHGGGRLHDAETPDEIVEVVLAELDEARSMLAQEIKLTLGVPSGAIAEALGTYPQQSSDGGQEVLLGSMSAGQTRTVVYETAFLPVRRVEAPTLPLGLRWVDDNAKPRSISVAPIGLRYAQEDQDALAERDLDASRKVARVWQADIVRQVAQLNREGDLPAATQHLESQIALFEPYVNGVPGTTELVTQLHKMRRAADRPMHERTRKEVEYSAYLTSKCIKDTRKHNPRAHWSDRMGPDASTHHGKPGTSTPRSTAADKQSFPFRMVNGHPVARIDDREVLLDTGAPVSVGRSDSIWILGVSHALQSNYLGLDLDALSAMIGQKIDVLLGTDVLSHTDFTIDPRSRQVVFYRQPVDGLGTTVPVSLTLGVPSLDLSVDDRTFRVFFDTAAKISYLPGEIIGARPSEREVEDFYPMLGRFRTKTRPICARVGEARLTIEFGALPPVLALMLGAASVDGILGAEVLQHFVVCFSLSRGLIYLDPLQPAYQGADHPDQGAPRRVSSS